jgi:hypothetical protein
MTSSYSVNNQLQDYLKKSSNGGSSWKSAIPTLSPGGFPWFGAKDSTAADALDDGVANGWFSDAQKDPLLPSLVCQLEIFSLE